VLFLGIERVCQYEKELETMLKQTAKIAGITCLTAGASAVLNSGMALTAMVEGGKYLTNAVKRIIKNNDGSSESSLAADSHLVNT